jgi:hypothetical protein
MDLIEKGTYRRHTFFSIDRERHEKQDNFIEAKPKTIRIGDREVNGWIITTEEPAIDATITLAEATERDMALHDPE